MSQEAPIRVLMITSGWPQPGQPQTTHFVKRQAEFLRKAGVEVDVFFFRGARRLWNYVRAWLQVRPKIRSGGHDLVHAQFGQSGLLALPKDLPLIVTLRGSDILGIVGPGGRHTLQGRISTALARLVVRRADGVVVVSEHMKDHFTTKAPVLVLPSGLDFELFRTMPRDEARRRLGWSLDKRLVLFAGNPDLPRKRYPLAKAAVDILNRTLPAELVVAWGVPHSDIPLYMNACDAFVFTSMQEGSPNVVKEALACDLPVVSVKIGDVAERLQGIEGCELCADERPETIAAGLERVLRRGGRVAGRAAVAHLAEEAITARLLGLYRSVLSTWAGRAAATPDPVAGARRRSGTALPATEPPKVTVIVPCRNEERYIGPCLDSILASDYPKDRLEVLVVDGMSEDRTREILRAYGAKHPWIRLIDNPKRITPVALNLAIRASTGTVLVRMDAHVVYPQYYISRLVAALEKYGADNVGGVLRTLPAGDGAMARAIAIAMSHPFGVGTSYFRIGTNSPRWVDTIAFFCVRREMFDLVGLFDEELIRHQDGEFNARLIKRGGRILLVPDVESRYYARATLRQTARMFYQYGYFKPLVAKKLGRFMTVRQLVPPLFVLGLGVSGLAALLWTPAVVAFGLVAASYAVIVAGSGIRAATRHGPGVGVALAAALPVMHISYGSGFWRRVVELLLPARRTAAERGAELPLSR